jgi:hypothetical protein
MWTTNRNAEKHTGNMHGRGNVKAIVAVIWLGLRIIHWGDEPGGGRKESGAFPMVKIYNSIDTSTPYTLQRSAIWTPEKTMFLLSPLSVGSFAHD